MSRKPIPVAVLLAAVLVGVCVASDDVGVAGVQTAGASWPPGCSAGFGLGATLLIPYFEVDLDDTDGMTTLISVNNGLDSPGVARIVLWTDWGVPTLAFDVYLGPFDIHTIDLRSVLHGVLPSTGEAANLDDFPFCDVFPPHHASPAFSAERISQLQAAHTGQEGPVDGLCHGADHGDGLARGYVTVDSASQCSGLESVDPRTTPANPASFYFDNDMAGGLANDIDMLWGDVVYLDHADNAAQGNEAVSLWADPLGFGDSDIYTFYGRFSDWDGRDDRVPLPAAWMQRFLNGGTFAGGADLIVFRQPNHADASPVACGETPGWYPLQAAVVSSDEDGEEEVTHRSDTFGLVTQRVPIGALEPAPSAAFGRIEITGDSDQLWVQPVLTGLGRFGVGFDGTPLTTLCNTRVPEAAK